MLVTLPGMFTSSSLEELILLQYSSASGEFPHGRNGNPWINQATTWTDQTTYGEFVVSRIPGGHSAVDGWTYRNFTGYSSDWECRAQLQIRGVGDSVGESITIGIRDGSNAQVTATSVVLTDSWQRVEVIRTGMASHAHHRLSFYGGGMQIGDQFDLKEVEIYEVVPPPQPFGGPVDVWVSFIFQAEKYSGDAWATVNGITPAKQSVFGTITWADFTQVSSGSLIGADFPATNNNGSGDSPVENFYWGTIPTATGTEGGQFADAWLMGVDQVALGSVIPLYFDSGNGGFNPEGTFLSLDSPVADIVWPEGSAYYIMIRQTDDR